MWGNKFSIRQALAFGIGKSIEHLGLLIRVALTYFGVICSLLLGAAPFALLFYAFRDSGAFMFLFAILLLAYAIFAALFLLQMIHLGLTRLSLDIYERNASVVERLFSCFHLLRPYIKASIIFAIIMWLVGLPLHGLMYFAGFKIKLGSHLAMAAGLHQLVAKPVYLLLALLYVPVVLYIGVRLRWFMYPMVDNNMMSARAALKRSWHFTDGSVLRLILFDIILGLVPVGLAMFAAANIAGIVEALQHGWRVLSFLPMLLLAGTVFLLALVLPMIMFARVFVYKKLAGGSQ